MSRTKQTVTMPVVPTAAQAEERVARALRSLDRERRDEAKERMRLLVETLGETPADTVPELVSQVGRLLADGRPDRMWLARSVLSGRLPGIEQMSVLLRKTRLEGAWPALLPSLRRAQPGRVRVVVGGITCDIHHTAATDYMSGIQRVVRSVAVRWAVDHDIHFLGWAEDLRSLRYLGVKDHRRIFGTDPGERETSADIVVPWAGTHLVPELAADPGRNARLMALAKYSGNKVGQIGYDCIPLTTASSVAPGMVGNFARYLATCREVDRIVAISEAAASEYRGWRGMLAGVRSAGPEVGVATLPVAAQEPSDEAIARARITLGMTHAPMILVVGSHEPRKNHLAVLHAAELLWREGVRFTLTLVGAGAWRADAYELAISELQGAGRAVRSIRGVPDDQLWAAFKLAHCTLFPSLNEGFGLPVAESLAAGTPVIASDFGSTRDIVAPEGTPIGGLLVDPRDDHAIADALRSILTDPAVYQRLKAEAGQHKAGSWDDYAREVWDFLVEDGE